MTGTADQPGLIPLSIRGCFDYLKHMLHPREFLLRLSYMEVYKEHIRDLLAPSTENAAPIRLFETAADGLVIKGLREEVVTCPEQVFALLAEGESRRQVGATHLNAHSSRSHVIVRLWIESRALPEGISGGSGGGGGLGQRITSTSSSTSSLASSSRLGPHVRISSLSLVDLAGSESVRLTGNNDRRQEGHYINQSLMTLGKVVYALSEIGDGSPGGGGSSSNNNNKKSLKQQHIPYRDSKLTRLLQPSLSGNAQLMLVCCISPLAQHMEESHNTCKFAIRAKKIPQKATIQEAPSDDRTLLQSYRVEIEDLKQQLREAEEAKKLLLEQGSSSSPTSVSATIPIARRTVPPSSQEQQHQLQQQQQRSSGGLLAEDVVSEDEIKELVSSIQTMEKLILKSKPISPTTTNTTTTTFQRPEDLMDSEHWDDDDAHNIDDEEDLLALATTKSEGAATTTTSASTSMIDSPTTTTTTTRSAQTPTMGSTASSTDEMDKNLQIELSRIQGLLGSVLMKRKSRQQQHHHQQQQQGGVFFSSMSSSITATTTSTTNTTNTTTPVTSSCSSDQEVAHLRAQLEQQELTTTIRKADSSFLQKQLEEKDDLLMEVSKVLEAFEKENANLRNELAILQCAAAAQNNQNNNQKQ